MSNGMAAQMIRDFVFTHSGLYSKHAVTGFQRETLSMTG
jgi:hypothetical protein